MYTIQRSWIPGFASHSRYAHTPARTHARTHARTNTRMHTLAHAQMYSCTHACIHPHAQTHQHKCVSVCVWERKCVHVCECVSERVCFRVCVKVSAHTRWVSAHPAIFLILFLGFALGLCRNNKLSFAPSNQAPVPVFRRAIPPVH